jgi:hypothetical protein
VVFVDIRVDQPMMVVVVVVGAGAQALRSKVSKRLEKNCLERFAGGPSTKVQSPRRQQRMIRRVQTSVTSLEGQWPAQVELIARPTGSM